MQQTVLSPTMSPSVLLHGGRPATTSLEVAKFFGKRHDHVLRDIDNLLSQLPEKSLQPNFGETFQEQETPFGVKQIRLFILYRDGFMLLVMGYTGKKALQIKLAYIEAFNRMEAQLAAKKVEPSTSLPQPSGLLPPSHQAQLKAIVDAKVGMLPSEMQRKAYAEIWSRFSRHFQIARYQQLPAERVGEAISYLVDMQLHGKKSLLQNKEVPAPTAMIDETPFLKFAANIQTARDQIARILDSLTDEGGQLSRDVSIAIYHRACIKAWTVPDLSYYNTLFGLILHNTYRSVTKAVLSPSVGPRDETNPGYQLLGIVRQLNSIN